MSDEVAKGGKLAIRWLDVAVTVAIVVAVVTIMVRPEARRNPVTPVEGKR